MYEVVIAGDFCDRYSVAEKIREGNSNEIFKEIRPLIERADFRIVNFEFPVVKGKSAPIPKCGPNLLGSVYSVNAIKDAGFNVCTLANNHILDQGANNDLLTKKCLKKLE